MSPGHGARGPATRDRAMAGETSSQVVADSAFVLEVRWIVRVIERLQPFWTFGVLVLLVVSFGLVAPDFFSRLNWLATSNYAVEILLLGVGQTFVIITGGIDLSDGAVLGFSSMASAMLMSTLLNHHSGNVVSLVIGFAAAIVIGALVGVVNGIVITKLQLAPFIVTLGMLSAATGGMYLLNNGGDVMNLPPQMGQIGTEVVGSWLPTQVIVAAVVCIVFGLLLARTRFGRRTYAIGSNREAARRAGINVHRHLMIVYAISGGLAGVAGLMLMAQFAEASVTAGVNEELLAIAAVVIGGASLFGGTGSVWKMVMGTFVLSVLVTGLTLANVAPFWQEVAVGVIMILAVYLAQLRRKVQMRT
jgi:ribose transport system permease protein